MGSDQNQSQSSGAESASAADSEPMLVVDGQVERPLRLSYADLEQFSGADRIDDVSQFDPQRKGTAVTLEALLLQARPQANATFLTLHASRDDFAASIPLQPVRAESIVIYRLDGAALPVERGGPFRFLIKDPAACHTDELDDCANVKFVDRIELTDGRGRDTRPETEDEHARLHEHEPSG